MSQQRQGKVIDIASALGGVEVPHLSRLEDPEFWARKDREVAEIRAAQRRKEEAQHRELRREVMLAAGAPRRDVELCFDGGLDERTPAMLSVSTWRGGGLRVLSGGTGAGKTLAAVWWVAWYGGPRARFLRANELEAAGRYDKAMRAWWSGASALVLDDLGAESVDGKGQFLSTLDELTDLYHGDRRPLIMTTNLPAAAFKERYGARIASRVRGSAGWCPLADGDRRAR